MTKTIKFKLSIYWEKWKSLSIKCNLIGTEALKAVESNGYELMYVKEQTPEVCLKAVEADGDALMYVKEQTPEVCLKAVESNGDALRYVKEQTFKQAD